MACWLFVFRLWRRNNTRNRTRMSNEARCCPNVVDNFGRATFHALTFLTPNSSKVKI